MSVPETWLLVRDGVVVDACLWNGDLATWSPPADVEAVRAADQPGTWIEFVSDGEHGFEPPPPED